MIAIWQKEQNLFWEEKNKEKASKSDTITPLKIYTFLKSQFTSSVIESKDDVASS